eukprot:gene5970-biopygen3584
MSMVTSPNIWHAREQPHTPLTVPKSLGGDSSCPHHNVLRPRCSDVVCLLSHSVLLLWGTGGAGGPRPMRRP